MTETVGNRVRRIRKEHSLTQKEFGDSISLAHSSICLLEKNKLGRIDRTINAICKEFRINKDWLLTGCGEMYIKTNSPIQPYLETELRKIPSLFETAQISAKHMTYNDWKSLNDFMNELEE